jgi:hypothetical protein
MLLQEVQIALLHLAHRHHQRIFLQDQLVILGMELHRLITYIQMCEMVAVRLMVILQLKD